MARYLGLISPSAIRHGAQNTAIVTLSASGAGGYCSVVGSRRRVEWLMFVWWLACAVVAVALVVATVSEFFLVWFAVLPSSDEGADSEGLVWLYGLILLVVLWLVAVMFVFRPYARRFRSMDGA